MAIFVAGTQSLTPSEYAQLAVKSAQEVANSAIGGFVGPQVSGSDVAASIICRRIPAYLQYVALGIATFWFYAVVILRAKEDVQKDMIQGLHDRLNYLSMEGEVVPPGFRPDLLPDVEAYLNAQLQDYEHPTAEGVYNPDICAVAKLHNEKMERYYSPLVEADRLILGTLAADITAHLLGLMQRDLKLILRQ